MQKVKVLKFEFFNGIKKNFCNQRLTKDHSIRNKETAQSTKPPTLGQYPG